MTAQINGNGCHSSARFPADNRVEAGSVNITPASYPPTIASLSIDPEAVASQVVDALNKSLGAKDYSAISKLFVTDGYWRDHLCLSWDLRTFKGQSKILDILSSGLRLERIELDKSAPHRAPQITAIDVPGEVKVVQFFINATTQVGTAQGVIRLTQENAEWKILTLFTSLRELTNFPDATGPNRPIGAEHVGQRDDRNWLETRTDFVNEIDPTVLIIGAGQGGLSTSARLGMLNIPTLVIDRNSRVGDNWRGRYRRLVLHDPVWFNHMPYLNFPKNWPIFTPKDKLAEFFEAYVKLMELNIWTQTTMKERPTWDESKQRWTVQLERQVGTEKLLRTVHPRHIIQATGHSGKKNMPEFKGMESFKGRVYHSSEFPGATPGSKGKRAIVVGSCNSGHDIAHDFYENGYDVTMVQRSSTCVISSKSITTIGLRPLYDEGGPPVDDADLLLWSMPSELAKAQQIQLTRLMNKNDEHILKGLESVGFKVDMGPNAAGLFYKYFQRGGGYYIDVGASQLIIDGKIKIKQGQNVAELVPDGVLFSDGSKLEADEIVFATGYQNMRTQAREIFGDELANRIQDVWGMTEEGEFRTMWQRSGHPGFWFMGANLALSRYYSRMLALQIKASVEGLVTADSK